MITIDQLLESVDYKIELKWVTKDKDGTICLFGGDKPEIAPHSDFWAREEPCFAIHHIKLADFENKPWQECIYEVPQKTTGGIKKIEIMPRGEHTTVLSLFDIALKVNEIIDKIETLEERTEDVCARIIEVERAVYPVQN